MMVGVSPANVNSVVYGTRSIRDKFYYINAIACTFVEIVVKDSMFVCEVDYDMLIYVVCILRHWI